MTTRLAAITGFVKFEPMITAPHPSANHHEMAWAQKRFSIREKHSPMNHIQRHGPSGPWQ
jgi:hypothetical protein